MYVIIGEKGEYSDREVWVVGVYDSKEEAQRFMQLVKPTVN